MQWKQLYWMDQKSKPHICADNNTKYVARTVAHLLYTDVIIFIHELKSSMCYNILAESGTSSQFWLIVMYCIQCNMIAF